MAEHNYLTDTYDTNTAILNKCKTHIAEIVLPSEPASQFDSVEVIGRLLIGGINNILRIVSQLFEGQADSYRSAKESICLSDTDYGRKIDDYIDDIGQVVSIINKMTSYMVGSNKNESIIFDVNGTSSVNSVFENELQLCLYSIYSNNYLENMGEEQLKSYCKVLSNIDEANLSQEDKGRIEDFLKCLISKKSGKYANEIVELYEKIYGEIKINDIPKHSWDDYSTERYKYVKYLVCLGWSDILISKYYSTQICSFTTQEAVDVFPQFGEDDCIRQGQFELCDLKMEMSDNGEAKFSTIAKQKTPACNGAVIVFDKNGNVIKYVKLNRYDCPTDFMSYIDWQINAIKGKDYSETRVDVTIPPGGFVEITDDPEIIEDIPLLLQSHKSAEEMIANSEDLAEGLSGTKPNLSDPSDTATLAADIVKAVAETVNDLEAKYWSEQQRDSGSLIFYNF